MKKPEIAYLIKNILPVLTKDYDFPDSSDDRTKINEIPVHIGSGTQKPDVVYYSEGIPVFLLETKREGQSEVKAIEQALSYIRNFPVKTYSLNNIRPKFFAVTIGSQIIFFRHRYVIEGDNYSDYEERLDSPLHFSEILQKYGLGEKHDKEKLTKENFRRELLNELGPIYKFEGKITPDVIKNVSSQILAFLAYGLDFTSHLPYVDSKIEKHKDRQAQIRLLFNRFDWSQPLGPDVADEFRDYILRSFQGTFFNQYLTEQCIIDFMISLLPEINKGMRIIDFKCGSGGFLASVISKGASPNNIMGIDISELPYVISQTYMALYFYESKQKNFHQKIIKKDNGLFYQEGNWDIVLSNPAGGAKYKHGDERALIRNGLLNIKNRKIFTEYEFSIQQAIRLSRKSGHICLILPDGFFSNSQDDYLRKLVAKHCKVLAIISLPRGAFRKGTSVKNLKKGSQIASQKMSILYTQKLKEIDEKNPIRIDNYSNMDYPIFLASIGEPKSKKGEIKEWLAPILNIILEQWNEWKTKGCLKPIKQVDISKKASVTIKIVPSATRETKKPSSKKSDDQQKQKPKINKSIENIFD